MAKLTIVVLPEGGGKPRQFTLRTAWLRLIALLGTLGITALTFLVIDYLALREVRGEHARLVEENQGLKGEGEILVANLQEVKRSLRRVKDFTNKLSELATLKVETVSKKTGIGPLSDEEFRRAKSAEPRTSEQYFPAGLNLQQLKFRTVFQQLDLVHKSADIHSVKLKQLLSQLSQQKSLLASTPSIAPVNGWLASAFGPRVSPFTGKKRMHMGIDIAAPQGTPITAPADGVVVYSGKKGGFGNFIMIAHGYGVVSKFGHNAQNLVQIGQRIHRGEQIATVGMTGRTTGPHLHYEVWVNGKARNPKKFILGDGTPDLMVF